MPTTSTPSATRLRNRMRRVRLEKMWWPRKRRIGTVIRDSRRGKGPRDLREAITGFCSSISMAIQAIPQARGSANPGPFNCRFRLHLAEAVADAVQGFDHLEILVN